MGVHMEKLKNLLMVLVGNLIVAFATAAFLESTGLITGGNDRCRKGCVCLYLSSCLRDVCGCEWSLLFAWTLDFGKGIRGDDTVVDCDFSANVARLRDCV